MNREIETKIDKLANRLKSDADLLGKDIKSIVEKAYEDGYQDAINNGFVWIKTDDKMPSDSCLKLVTVQVTEEAYEGTYIFSETRCGYYRKGDWYVNGWMLGDNEDVIAWGELPSPYSVSDLYKGAE